MDPTIRVALIGQKFMGRAHANAWGQVNRFFDLPVEAQAEIVAGRVYGRAGSGLANLGRSDVGGTLPEASVRMISIANQVTAEGPLASGA